MSVRLVISGLTSVTLTIADRGGLVSRSTSKPISFDQVRAGVVNFGDLATLITVGDGSLPHVLRTSSALIVGVPSWR
jgi:hypothetical protein